MAAPAPEKCKVALLQVLVGTDKKANLDAAAAAIDAAAAGGAQIVALPECFNSPYATDQFPVYAEPIPANKAGIDPDVHTSTAVLSAAAARNGIYLIGGACPSRRKVRRTAIGS
jgi:omega-amidase